MSFLWQMCLPISQDKSDVSLLFFHILFCQSLPIKIKQDPGWFNPWGRPGVPFCAESSHVHPALAWVSFRCSGFLPQYKDMATLNCAWVWMVVRPSVCDMSRLSKSQVTVPKVGLMLNDVSEAKLECQTCLCWLNNFPSEPFMYRNTPPGNVIFPNKRPRPD